MNSCMDLKGGLAGLAFLAALSIASPAAFAADQSDGWPELIGAPITLEDTTQAAEIHATLARTSETVPSLFRLTLSRANAEMGRFKREAQEELAEIGDDPDFPWRTWTYDLVFEEYYARQPLYSQLEMKANYTGGAHPNTDFDVVNFDARNGTEFGLYDIFDDLTDGSPLLIAMAAYTREDLAVQKSGRFGDTVGADDEWLDSVTPSTETFRLFTLAPAANAPGAAGLTIHFPPYAVGPYAEGSYEVFIPAEVFAEYLQPEFADVFGGMPIDLERVTEWQHPGALLLSKTPRGDDAISSPLTLEGEAPSHWFFEGVANVEVRDDSDNVVGTGFVTWNPEAPTSGVAAGMVAYSGEVTFDAPSGQTGAVIVGEEDVSDGEGGPVESVSIYVSFP